MEQFLNLSYWMWVWGWGAEQTRDYFRQWPRKQVSSDTHAEKR